MDRSARSPAAPGEEFRGAAGQVASGVAIVIAVVDGEPHGATASSCVVVSVEPPLVAVLFSVGGRMHRCLVAGTGFTVNMLRHTDHGLARRFADPTRARGGAGFAGVDLLQRGSGRPILAGAAAWFDCRLRQVVLMGDHACFVGEVVECGRDPEAPPLVYHRGRLHGLGRPVVPAAWATLDRSDLVADW